MGNRGISHCDEVDMRRKKIKISLNGIEVDIVDFYLDIAENLEREGY